MVSLLNGPVKIGLLWPMTGPQSWAGLECIEAGQAIVAMLEDEGVIDRGQVELLVGDASSAESTLNVAREHIANGAPTTDSRVLALLPADVTSNKIVYPDEASLTKLEFGAAVTLTDPARAELMARFKSA